MKISILGSGIVGQTLGRGFAERGHDVMMGTRDPRSDKIAQWVSATGHGATAGTFDAAAKFGEIAVLCTLWEGTRHAIELAGPANLAGKVVIDTTNPLDFSGRMPPTLSIGHTTSAGEQVQHWLPDAKVVKAFNSVGNAHMVAPSFPDGTPALFIAGNDEGAKQAVSRLAAELGWPAAVDTGPIEQSRYLEPLAMLWITLGAKTGTWNHAFAMLRR